VCVAIPLTNGTILQFAGSQDLMNIQSIILYTTASHEYRVPQVRYFAKCLKDAGFDTTVAGPLGPTCVRELQETGVHVCLKFLSPKLKRLKLYNLVRLLDVVIDHRIRCDLAVGVGSAGLMLAYLAYRLRRAKHLGAYFIEYDPPGCYRHQIRHYPHLIAPKLAEKLDILIDVNSERLERRRDWMFVPERAAVLMNVPQRAFVRETAITEDESQGGPLRFLYQGTLGSANGLKPLFDAFRLVDPLQYTLTLAGYSDRPEALVNQIADQFPAGNVRYDGLISRTELPDFVSRHHIGIALYPWRDDPFNPGFELCAPNKLYEYLARGLPVICSDNATLLFVEERKLGWRIDPRNSRQLADLIMALCQDRASVRDHGNNALRLCQDEYNFESNFAAIVDIIRRA
jgi:glycosyltransferase involved in cell wall biosynthesis